MLRSFLLVALAASPLASAQSIPAWAAPTDAVMAEDEAPVVRAPMARSMPPSVPGAPTSVPLDGGLALLALTGAGYATRRLRRAD